MGHRVALSRYAPALNESTNDRYQIIIGEPNPKSQFDKYENCSNLTLTPQSLVESIWDCIIVHP